MPTYNHTREDSALTPCPLCEALELLWELQCVDCWCEVGIGNPMLGGRHTSLCLRVRRFLEKVEK